MKTGVLLVNLGTPKSFRAWDVFSYLNEFLTDGRVIDLSWLRRQFLVRGVIVPFRFRASAKQYRGVWTDKGSPLLVHGIEVQDKLQARLGAAYHVKLAMRYQLPSIQEGLAQLEKEKLDQLIILPLFPQYASATTGSVHQKVMQFLQHWTVLPKLTFINHYFDHPALIEAFCGQTKKHLLAEFDHVLFSFHGLPERQIRKADQEGHCLTKQCCQKFACQTNRFCYKSQCYTTAQAIAQRLGLKKEAFTICFQSRLGKDPWIQPYFSDVLQACVVKGQKNLLVFSPSFVCDCLETICEIENEYGHVFKKMGGHQLQLVEGLNSHPSWIEALRCLILEHSRLPEK